MGDKMSLVRRKIYICDHCGAIELAERYDCSLNYRLPYGWGKFGRNHLCPSCYTAWVNLKNQAESEGEDEAKQKEREVEREVWKWLNT